MGYLDDKYDVSLLHMDGADASTTFTDESVKVWTRAGNAQIDTAQSVFGGASGKLDGTGDYIKTPTHADFGFGVGDFTTDFRVRLAALPGGGSQMAVYSAQDAAGAGSTDYYKVALKDTQVWQFEVSVGGILVLVMNKATTVLVNTWYHIAVVRHGNDFGIYQNGTLLVSEDTAAITMPNVATTFAIGFNNRAHYYVNGWIDEFRISKGIARWTANFTPPTAAYGFVPKAMMI